MLNYPEFSEFQEGYVIIILKEFKIGKDSLEL